MNRNSFGISRENRLVSFFSRLLRALKKTPRTGFAPEQDNRPSPKVVPKPASAKSLNVLRARGMHTASQQASG